VGAGRAPLRIVAAHRANEWELYYRDGDKMTAVTVSTAPGFSAGRPQVLRQGHYSHGMSASLTCMWADNAPLGSDQFDRIVSGSPTVRPEPS
jgi:hypothetical protein